MGSASGYPAARRVLALYVRAVVSDWTRRGLVAVSADRIAALGVATGSGEPGRGDILPQGVRIVYAGGESARLLWDDGVWENVPVPRHRTFVGSPTRRALARHDAARDVTFHVRPDEASALNELPARHADHRH